MTTIVYDHINKQIAVDSRETAGDEIKTDTACKHYTVDGVLYFMCGCPSDYPAFFSLNKLRGAKPEVEIDCASIFIKDGVVFKASFSNGVYWELQLSSSDYLGSGGVYARCALDFGKTSSEAVDYAKTKDTHTGGTTVVFDISKNEFI